VFVHGLQGHPRKTWARRVLVDLSEASAAGSIEERQKQKRRSIPWRRESGSKESLVVDEVFWPADLLPLDCPDARVLTWGYDSKISNFFGGAANKGNIAVYSKDLLYALARERSDCVRFPG
jgi:ankyrin repeat domain-containing protein 50